MKFGKIGITVFLFCGEAFSQGSIDFTQVEHYSSRILENDYYRNQSLQYVTTENTMVYSNDWELTGAEEKNKIMENCHLTITSDHYLMIGRNDYWINADDLHISESNLFPKEIVYNQIRPEYEWIPVWYNEVVKCKDTDFEKVVYKYAPFLEGKWLSDSECWWYEDDMFSYPCVFRFQNTYLCLTVDGWGVQQFLIEKIIERNKSYYINCKSIGFYYDEYKDNFRYLENFPRVNNGEKFVLRLEQDKGHLFLYNDETNKLIVELMAASKAWIKKLQNYFKTGINDFSIGDESLLSRKIDAPTTEYIEPAESENPNEEMADTSAENTAIPKPAPAIGKTVVVTENLRLRTNDKATAEVVTTLAAGTRVKVLRCGRESTIDGIASSWVQVRMLGGAKDTAGNAIERGTTGWLFGGYLAEAEDSDESESPDTEKAEATNTPAAKRGSLLPLVPIAGGVAVLVVLLAVIILATKKWKNGKK